jgi:hypothetical protein
LVEFFVNNNPFDGHAWALIYYTGKAELVLERNLLQTVLIINGRPDLDKVSKRSTTLGRQSLRRT